MRTPEPTMMMLSTRTWKNLWNQRWTQLIHKVYGQRQRWTQLIGTLFGRRQRYSWKSHRGMTMCCMCGFGLGFLDRMCVGTTVRLTRGSGCQRPGSWPAHGPGSLATGRRWSSETTGRCEPQTPTRRCSGSYPGSSETDTWLRVSNPPQCTSNSSRTHTVHI